MSILKLNELIVVNGDTYVYHEKFDNKVNIIRGDNSTGKSSIASFIFFALGGDFTEWLPEAKSCDYVLAELSINDVIVSVRRNIDKNDKGNSMSLRPMYININPLNIALKSYVSGWKIYPYSKSDTQESFSQIIFNLLNFPEISTENQETITINQILRLIYIDQLSSLNTLMRNEDFDSPLVRDAIGNLLLGTYSDEKLKFEKDLREVKKEQSEIKSQVNAMEDVFKNSSFEFSSTSIEKGIIILEKRLKKINETLSEPDKLIETSKATDTKKELDELRSKLVKAKKKYEEFKKSQNTLQSNYIDGKEFIEVLEDKLIEIEKSINTRQNFGKLNLKFCPSCLEKLTKVDENQCSLCKEEINDPVNIEKFTRMRLELEMQLKESKQLLAEREEKLEGIRSSINEASREVKRAQSDYDLFISKSRSSFDNKIDKVIEEKGKVTYEIEFLKKQLELISSYEEYKIKLSQLAAQRERLESEIKRLGETQKRNASQAYTKINEYALRLIKADGDYEDKFKNGRITSIDFRENTFYLDGRNRFSASSMVVLKNCIRFAIFFASIELDFFRYPKFILCDNVEDKGMVDDRSKNFQREVVSIAESEIFEDKDFQIIFTTSKIAEELNIPKYTVGEYYTPQSKSIKFEGVS